MAAGDAQTADTTIHKAGAQPVDQQALTWADLHKKDSDKRSGLGIEPAQATGVDVMNRNRSGPVGNGNIYAGPGGGVAGGFHLPDGSRPQDSIAAQPAATPGQPGQSAWDKQAAAGQARLDQLAAQNQQAVAETTKSIGTPATGNGDKPEGMHTMGKISLLGGVGLTSLYAGFGHPRLQKPLIAQQIKADDLAAMGKQNNISKLVSIPRKYYQEQFSPVYEAQTNLAKILPQEEAARKGLTALKQTAEEKVEALTMKAADVKNLRKMAATTPAPTATQAELDAIAKADRQVKIIDAVGKSAPAKAGALAEAQAQANFLKDNAEFLSTKANPGALNWEGFAKGMGDVKAFSGSEMKGALDMAAADRQIFSIGGKEMTRSEMQALVKASENAGSEAWAAKGLGLFKLGGRTVGTAVVVGGLATLQGNTAESLHQNGHDALAKLIEPNMPGVVAKSAALMLAPTWKGAAMNFAAGQLLETETNMTRIQRLGTLAVTGTGLGLTKYLAEAQNMPGLAKFAKTALVADIGVTLIAEAADDLFYHNDNTLKNAGDAMKNVVADPNDYSHSSLRDKVQGLVDQGKKDPFLMTQNFDTITTSPNMKVTQADNTATAALKYKDLMIVQQAQGETILANGMSKSQYLKMQSPNSPIQDNEHHREDWVLCPDSNLDIASQGSRALIQALGSANLTEAFLARQGSTGDANQVDKQRADIKAQLDQVFNSSHGQQLVDALTKTSWLKEGDNTYNLPQLWEHNNSDYLHMYDMVASKAQLNAQRLGTYQQALDGENQRLQAARQSGDQGQIAMETKFVQSRQDALTYNTAYTAKLFRDAALLKLGETQSILNIASQGKVTNTDDINGQLQLAKQNLAYAANIAANNPDLQQLNAIYVKMAQRAATIVTPSYQPNH
jgi:hypothetical protein